MPVEAIAGADPVENGLQSLMDIPEVRAEIEKFAITTFGFDLLRQAKEMAEEDQDE